MNKRLVLATALSCALFGASAQSADIVPVNFDDPAEGYNDTTPVAPVGGNPGVTLGEQRRIAAQFAADLWGSVLQSDVPVFIGAEFTVLAPNVLGSAGATSVFSDFPNAGVPATWYSSALADAIAGVDLKPGFIDIRSNFSSSFPFYYGLDGNTPAGQVNFLDVVMHEFGHGLGFQNFENEAAGTFLSSVPDIYSTYTFDNSTGKSWTQMTIAERQASALNYGNVVFTGTSATAGAALILDERIALRVIAPSPIAGDYAYGTASFGPVASQANFAGEVIIATDASDGAGISTTDGCSPINNDVSGKVALMDRGSCTFNIKVKNAQNAGATAVLIADSAAGSPPPGLGGADATITIPSLRITRDDGIAFKANLPLQVSFVVDPSKLQGADDAGRPRLFMPNPVQSGSSGSHYDTALLPNALMEPAINTTLRSALNLDITPNLLKDTGWTLNEGNATLAGCDTTIDVVDDAGIIVGANVQATSNVCLFTATTKSEYVGCMDAYKEGLVASGLITGRQGGKLMACAGKILKK